MIIELILRGQPKLELGGYERLDLGNNVVFANPRDKRVEIVLKTHSDGRVSVFTDDLEVIRTITQATEVLDIHAK